jgi:uncharacterized repeat protein (TIGR01451 family)
MLREYFLKGKNKEFSMKFVSVILVSALVLVSFFGLLKIGNDGTNVSAATTLYVGGSGQGNYTTIQSAIDNASSGDTVYVYSGLYNESLVINKTLTLTGQDMNTTIINGVAVGKGSGNRTGSTYNQGINNGTGSVVYITADGVSISGFTVRNGSTSYMSAGIELYGVKNTKIFNNNVSHSGNTGILASSSTNTSIRDNFISLNSWYGIFLYLSQNTNVINNVLTKNSIMISSSKHNLIDDNEITGPSKFEDLSGINIYYVSDNNKIVNNNIINWTGNGIKIHYSKYNNISNNDIDNNGHITWSNHSEYCGISLQNSRENIISGNKITKSGWCGIGSYLSGKNFITYNRIYDNPVGMWISTNEIWNLIYLNEFINNTKNTGEISSYNVWNSTLPLSYLYNGKNYTSYLGNYWDDYSGKDSDGNGIGDTPRIISNSPTNKDYFPLVSSIDNYTLIPSTTKMKLVEVSSNSTNISVSLLIKTAYLNASISGVLNGSINITKLVIVLINSSYFAGNGFFKSVYRAVLDGKVYEGTWQGMVFNKSGERRFYLKGTVFGGLRGLTDGYLVESSSGSGVYNLYNSTWTLNHLGSQLTFVQLNVNGSVDYQTSNNDKTEIYILQSSFKGNATGYYNKSIGLVLTHVRMNNKTKDLYGYGFSIISYNCAWGSGSGWTYDRTESPDITKLTGFFTEPLWGLIFGKLNESGPKRTLTITIERIDIGLPPRAMLIIDVWGPWRASPGQTINYCIEYKNIGLKSAYNTEIVMVLPLNTTYISNTGGGVYNKTAHEVIWRMNISAKSRGHLSVKVKVKWGLPWGTKLICKGFIRDYTKNRTLAIDVFTTRITPARDPNMKHGPEGEVASGQELNYRIEFENEGEGIAYGVYFTDELSRFLDDSTLKIGPVISTISGSKIAPPGIYNPSTRIITWFVGEVGPGAGGYSDISIRVRSDASAGTEILNYGTVYFPSVPEVTRTNVIVSIVRDNQRPVAIAGKKVIAKTYQTIIFNGSASFDPDGAITSYTWDFDDGAKGYGEITTHYYQDDGNYTVTLTVEDDFGTFDIQRMSVRVLNRPPIAKLVVESKDIKTNEITFNAAGSSDIDGTVAEYNLDLGDGASSGWVTSPVFAHKYNDKTQVYSVKLRVRDDDGAICKKPAELKVAVNDKPIPKLTVNPVEAYTYTDIECNGEFSNDLDGQINSYYFDFGDGTNSGWITTSSISHQYTDGTKEYTISLKVKDNYDALSDEVSIAEVLIRNRKPVPSLIVEETDIYVLSTVHFDASGSQDMDGEDQDLEYYIDFGDGTNSGWTSAPLIQHTYTKGPKDYPVELKVKDSDGEIETTVLSIMVKNRIPIADAGADRNADMNQLIDFDGSGSYDPEGGPLIYIWDFGDGTISERLDSATTTHTYTHPGDYTITLIVSDGTLTAKDTSNVLVSDVDSKKDTDGDGVPDNIDAFPYDAAASVDSDGDDYPDYWNNGKSQKDTTTGLTLDAYPDDPDRHSVDKKAKSSSENIYLIGIIIIFIIILIIGILSFVLRNNKNRRITRPFDSKELIRKVRDDIIQGEDLTEPGTSENELWTKLEQKYKNGQISEETFKLLEQEKLQNK